MPTKVTRISPCDWGPLGGFEVWADSEPSSIYLAPGCAKGMIEGKGLTDAGQKYVEGIVAQRAEDRKVTTETERVDSLLSAELGKRKEAAGDLTGKTEVEIVAAVFDAKVKP